MVYAATMLLHVASECLRMKASIMLAPLRLEAPLLCMIPDKVLQ